MRDRVFEEELRAKFEFNENVASVFDDMLSRSVPFYKESMGLGIDFLLKNIEEGERVYDLGCSTGTFLLELFEQSPVPLELIGIDNSLPMLERARKRKDALGAEIALLEGDILDFDYAQAGAFVANYTLQFIRPIYREMLVKKIYDALKADGVFIFSEKLTTEHRKLDKQMNDRYLALKASRGYSRLEITKKREALENVLVPYSYEENVRVLKNCGFSHVETLFRWVNFATFVALKD